jgi:hypothetical protein
LAEFLIKPGGNIKDIKILRMIEFLGDEEFNKLTVMPK